MTHRFLIMLLTVLLLSCARPTAGQKENVDGSTQADPAAREDEKGANKAGEEKEEQELKQLDGRWIIVKVENGELPEKAVERVVTFTSKKLVWGTKGTASIKIDPTRNPKWIDIQMDDLDEHCPGIYKFDGDRLIIVLRVSATGSELPQRPKAFDKGSGEQMLQLERVKRP